MDDFDHRKFAGLRNTVPIDQFDLGDLEQAVNVDIDDARRITRRKGFGPVLLAGDYKSLWSDGAMALAVKSQTQLLRIFPDYTTGTLRTGLTPGLDMAYTSTAGKVFYSNSRETGVVENGASRSWGLALPTQPDAQAVGGVLHAGRYQYAVTYVRNDGQESGTPKAGVFDLTAQGGIRLTGIPVSSDPGVVAKIVYFSRWDGETLYRVGVLDADVTTFDYLVEASVQVPLKTQHLSPPPAGQCVDHFKGGRTLVAADNTLYYSEPFALELFDLRKNFRLQDRITMLACLESGAYVSTPHGLFWLDGLIPEQWGLRQLTNYGAKPGALDFCGRDMVLDGVGRNRVAVFATSRGICVGEDGGALSNLTQSRFAYPIQDRGALVVRRHRGTVQAVVNFQGTEIAANEAS